jgi:N-methylhydantoinase B
VLDYKGPNERVVGDVAFGHVQQPGEILLAKKQGGGGWGNPYERDPEMVLRDVLDEYVSLQSAREDYGVVIDSGTWLVDRAATEQLRAGKNRNGSNGRS